MAKKKLKPKDISACIASSPVKKAVKILRILMTSDIKKAIITLLQIKPQKLISISNKLTSDEKKKLCDSATNDEDRQALGKLFYRFKPPDSDSQPAY